MEHAENRMSSNVQIMEDTLVNQIEVQDQINVKSLVKQNKMKGVQLANLEN